MLLAGVWQQSSSSAKGDPRRHDGSALSWTEVTANGWNDSTRAGHWRDDYARIPERNGYLRRLPSLGWPLDALLGGKPCQRAVRKPKSEVRLSDKACYNGVKYYV